MVSASLLTVACWFGSCFGEPAPTTHRALDRPNFVIIVADDLGWNDVGFHGSEIRTPRLDALARESVLFNQFYVFPTCSPTRAALLTGRNPNRFGIRGPLGLDPKSSLPLETVTLPEVLLDAGYSTALVGKWHLGPTFEFGPRRQGFQFAYGYLHGQIDQFVHCYKNLDKSWFRDEEFVDETGHATDLLANEAAAYIERNRERPFFLVLCFSVPHYPLQENDEWIEPYRATIGHHDRRTFAAAVTHMDHAIGRVIDTLDRAEVRERTLVLFTSDNGGQRDDQSPGQYGGKHGPYERLGDNRPLRGWKGEVYDGGIRVPALLHWRGTLAPGILNDVVSATDILPTFAALAGEVPAGKIPLDGIDVWPAISGSNFQIERTLYWNSGSQRAIRMGDWKLVETNRGKTAELFNLREDPFERRDLSHDVPGRASLLAEKLEQIMSSDPAP
jgi:arylsulfatase B